MADYPLVRAQSSLALARSETRPLLTRTYSVPDLGQYYQWSDKYKPQWHTTRTYTPYRYTRKYDLIESRWFDKLLSGRHDDYWSDRYYYFSPLYRTSLYPRWRYSYSDYLPNPYYWSPTSSYWSRYKGYSYDYDYPSYFRSTYDYPYRTYPSTYHPYRSYLLDSMSTSLARGLSMYRAGHMDYNTLYNYWLTPTWWDRRFKDWRELYVTQLPSVNDTPSYFNRRAREYFATWNNK